MGLPLRNIRFAALAMIFAIGATALAATTKLERTTVRKNPDAISTAVGVLPVGSNYEVLGESGSYTKIKFQAGGAWKQGFVSTSQLGGSADPLKSIGTTTAKKSGYGKADVAAAINMGAPVDAAAGLMGQASATRESATVAVNEMDDEFESLPEDITGAAEDTATGLGNAATSTGKSAVNSATSQAAKKKAELEQATNAKKIRGDADAKMNEATSTLKSKQGEATNAAAAKRAELEQATNAKKIRGDADAKMNEATSTLKSKQNEATGAAAAKRAELEAKKNEAANAPMEMMNAGRKTVDDKKAGVESQIGAQMGALNDQKAAVEGEWEETSLNKAASGATSNLSKAKGSVTAIGDMSGVEALESMQYSKTEFTSSSPFITEGRLKSKTLK